MLDSLDFQQMFEEFTLSQFGIGSKSIKHSIDQVSTATVLGLNLTFHFSILYHNTVTEMDSARRRKMIIQISSSQNTIGITAK